MLFRVVRRFTALLFLSLLVPPHVCGQPAVCTSAGDDLSKRPLGIAEAYRAKAAIAYSLFSVSPRLPLVIEQPAVRAQAVAS